MSNSVDIPCLRGVNGQCMVMAAFRYCLGRRSYIVGAGIDWLRTWRRAFDEQTRFVIVRDIVTALQDSDDAVQPYWGVLYQYDDWKALAELLLSELPAVWPAEVKAAVAYRNKPWPLSIPAEEQPRRSCCEAVGAVIDSSKEPCEDEPAQH